MQNNDISPFDRKLGSKVREARQLLGITQTKLGEAVGVTYQQIQKYETGKSRVTAERLDKLGKVLNLPLTYFFDMNEETRSQGIFPADTLRLAGSINDLPSDLIRTQLKRLVYAINTAWGKKIEI